MKKAEDTLTFVLVVEQEPAIVRFLSRGLALHGFGVLPASSCLDAVELIQAFSHAIDIALIDERLHALDGLATLRALLHLKPTLRSCIMGSTVAEERGQLLAAGAACLLPKPFGLAAVACCVRNLHKEVLASKKASR